MAVDVATNDSLGTSKASMAALLSPPWLPTIPPSPPDTAPARIARLRPMRTFLSNPVNPRIPTTANMLPKTIVSQNDFANEWRRAPPKPPIALVTPKVSKTFLSIDLRNTQQRRLVATRCGIVMAATANLVPSSNASSGVSRLPMPNPVTEASAPVMVAAMGSQKFESTFASVPARLARAGII